MVSEITDKNEKQRATGCFILYCRKNTKKHTLEYIPDF